MTPSASIRAEISNRFNRLKVGAHKILSGRGSASRLSSFPFVSGDTFRCLADLYIEPGAKMNIVEQRLSRPQNSPTVLFCEVSKIEDLRKLARDMDLSTVTVLIHNGDVIPTEAIFDLKDKVNRIFCVNWMGDREVAEPLPIGIENVHWNINGRLDDFVHYFPESLDELVSKRRPISCFQSFRIQTNPAEREGVAPIFASLKDASTCNDKISRAKFIGSLNRSKFVISPPGNGPDCHRTWEAMYAGAIPVVLVKSWPFQYINLPVLAVKNWNEAREILEGDVEALYRKIWRESDPSQMYFPAFQYQIWRE